MHTADEGVAAQLTGFLNNARSLLTHDLPLPKDWAVWTTTASTTSETDGGDDTASTDGNWWFSSPVNRPPNGPPDGRPPAGGPPAGRPPRPNNGNGNGNGNNGLPEGSRALQWEDGTVGGYKPYPTDAPTVPPTPAPSSVYGSFSYEEKPEYGRPVYEAPDHDKMGVVPGAEPAYRPKCPLVRALEAVQFKKARAGQQPPFFNLRGAQA